MSYSNTFLRSATVVYGALFLALAANADSRLNVSISETQRCFSGNGLPDHDTGRFPNSGNPNAIAEQSIQLCVARRPQKGTRAQLVRGSIGVAVNGVQFRPGTADYYDASSSRGFSRDSSSGWNLEGLGARELLGMDQNNAHVDERGLYHYHGVAPDLVDAVPDSLLGYAADGFEIHYDGDQQSSSYRLKSGTRPSGPGGRYDGTYIEDWEYVAGSGSLDQCNGGELGDQFVYFATDSYPFFPRCLWGNISRDFMTGPSRQESRGSSERTQPRHTGSRRGPPGPPQEALSACAGTSVGSSCSFSPPGRREKIQGTCQQIQSSTACVPKGGPPPPR
ncbi:MAG: YHYH protein [Pseudomonadota bacterium]